VGVEEVDVLIVGGGLTGAALMLALAESSLRVTMIEAKMFTDKISEEFDARTIALSPASVRILKMLNIWTPLNSLATPIETIHVSQQQRFGRTRLRGDAANPLGHVVEMQHLQQVFYRLLDHNSIYAPTQITGLEVSSGTVSFLYNGQSKKINAKLIVAADGCDSQVRKLCNFSVNITDYQQQAIVANIGLSRPHLQIAYERFTPTGPLALLPMTENRSALVWSLPPQQAEEYQRMPEPIFLNTLQRVFGYRLGKFIKVGQRSLFPLSQALMPKQIAWPVVFIGNAAHTLHPVAGQGFNLGLRDAALLAQAIVQKGLCAEMLEFYQRSRRHDQSAIQAITHGLVELFACPLPGVANLRGMGLIAVDGLQPLQKILTYYTQGFAGSPVDLVCGFPLRSRRDHEKL
jgi:2-octaprenyl-6-methoxyphenol hydroxylase